MSSGEDQGHEDSEAIRRANVRRALKGAETNAGQLWTELRIVADITTNLEARGRLVMMMLMTDMIIEQINGMLKMCPEVKRD